MITLQIISVPCSLCLLGTSIACAHDGVGSFLQIYCQSNSRYVKYKFQDSVRNWKCPKIPLFFFTISSPSSQCNFCSGYTYIVQHSYPRAVVLLGCVYLCAHRINQHLTGVCPHLRIGGRRRQPGLSAGGGSH